LAEQIGFVDSAGDAANDVGADLARGIANQLRELQGSADTLEDALRNRAAAGDSEVTFTANGIDFTLGITNDTAAIGALTAYYGATGVDDDGDPTGGTELEFGTASAAQAVFAGDYRTNSDLANRATAIEDLSLEGTLLEGSASGAEVGISAANALKGVLDGDMSSTRTIDISTQGAAQTAIQATRNAIDSVSELRAEFGANMNRFEAVISGNQTYSENLSAARSRIQDADFAVETANLAKQQVLQQAGISALGQANASSQAILGLL